MTGVFMMSDLYSTVLGSLNDVDDGHSLRRCCCLRNDVGEIDDDDDDAMMMMLMEIANATTTATRTLLRRRATLLDDDDCGASLSSDKLSSCWQLCKFLIERSPLSPPTTICNNTVSRAASSRRYGHWSWSLRQIAGQLRPSALWRT